jgi:hypothetical protein
MVRTQYLTLLGGRRWKEFAVSSTSEPTGYHPLASFKVGVTVQPVLSKQQRSRWKTSRDHRPRHSRLHSFITIADTWKQYPNRLARSTGCQRQAMCRRADSTSHVITSSNSLQASEKEESPGALTPCM